MQKPNNVGVYDEIEKAIIKKVQYKGNKSKVVGKKKKIKKKLDVDNSVDEWDGQ